jgi:hypothetical protein
VTTAPGSGVRLAVLAEAAVLFYGGFVHVYQLATGGWPPYHWAPAGLAIYFTSLTVLDPLAATLLLIRRRAGLYPAVLVLVTDAAANWYATYHLLPTTGNAQIGQAVISVLAVASVIVAGYARRSKARPPGGSRTSRADQSKSSPRKPPLRRFRL